jgi:polyhydroxyalkanoate synthase
MEAQPAAELMQQMAHLPQISPAALAELQADYLTQATALERNSRQAPARLAVGDRRFAAPGRASPAASFMASSTCSTAARCWQDGRGRGGRRQDQGASASRCSSSSTASPSNFLALNPEAQAGLDSQGETLARGLQHLWGDVQRGHVSQTDESAFEVGRNVATTAGVVFENELFQLIEYKPLTRRCTSGPSCWCRPASTSTTS